MLTPPPLCAGDLIQLVAPSGPVPPDRLELGIERLSKHFRLSVPADLKRRQGFLAGTDEERLHELQTALDNPEVRAIWVARGGYGLTRILSRLSWDKWLREPRWIIGFSDVTCLHLAAAERQLVTLHGPHVTTLSQITPEDEQALLRLLTGEQSQFRLSLQVVHPPQSEEPLEGPLWGGNLTLLFTEAAAGRLRIPPGALLFLEDVTETSYRMDRMLTALLDGGHLSQVRGILLGEFEQCSAGAFQVPVEEVFRERLSHLPCPVWSGLPVGHGARNFPLPHGRRARMSPRSGELSFSLDEK